MISTELTQVLASMSLCSSKWITIYCRQISFLKSGSSVPGRLISKKYDLRLVRAQFKIHAPTAVFLEFKGLAGANFGVKNAFRVRRDLRHSPKAEVRWRGPSVRL